MVALGLSGCSDLANRDAVLDGFAVPMADLQRGLLAHPETPEAVGEPATDLIVLYRAAVGR